MDDNTNLFNRFVFLMDQNIKGVQIGVYSVAFVGLAVALRSVRPFSRFKRPSDIPNGFLISRMKLKGSVDRIEPVGPLLMVQHKPLIRLSWSQVDSLPVKISGVTVNGHGISWLQSIVNGNEVTFVPVLKHKHCVDCEVTLEQETIDRKLRIVNVGPALVSIGFATVDPISKPLAEDPRYLAYYKQLKLANQLADKKRLGIWYYAIPTKNISLKLLNGIIALFKQKTQKRTQKSVPKIAAV